MGVDCDSDLKSLGLDIRLGPNGYYILTLEEADEEDQCSIRALEDGRECFPTLEAAMIAVNKRKA